MVNFLAPKMISGVETQGSPDSPRWVEEYYVYLSIDGIHFFPYTESDGDTTPYLFTGNTDHSTPVRNLFNRNIISQYVKIVPVKASPAGTGLRFTVIGCTPSLPAQGIPTPFPSLVTSGSTLTPGTGPTAVPTLPTRIGMTNVSE